MLWEYSSIPVVWLMWWKSGTSGQKPAPLSYIQEIRLPSGILIAGGAGGKEQACQCRRHKRRVFSPWVGKIPWSRKWQSILVFFLGNPMDRGAWRATAYGVPKSRTWLSMHALDPNQGFRWIDPADIWLWFHEKNQAGTTQTNCSQISDSWKLWENIWFFVL